MAASRPNFLFICVDQMRADHMGCDGNPVIRTPNLDALAEIGVNFTRGYVNCPLCQPGRATLFTGLTPFQELERKTLYLVHDLHPQVSQHPLGGIAHQVNLEAH